MARQSLVNGSSSLSYLLLLCLLAQLLLVSPAHAQTWEIEVLDNGKQFSFMTNRSLRLDAQGRPHIAYGEDWLYYAWYDGAEWQYEVADASPGVGVYASLDLDASGSPHISYHDTTNADLKYAYRDAAGWHVQTVDSQGSVGRYTSIAVDGSGHPHIGYSWGSGPYPFEYDLKYAYRDEAGWHVETVDSQGNVGECISIALDGMGHPHISYYDATNSDLKYAYRDASGWHAETVDSQGSVGGHTSIALDGSGHPHISYYDATNADLKYAYRDGAGWHVETVDSEGYVGWYTSIAVDGSGYPHIGYAKWNYYSGPDDLFFYVDDLKHAYWDGVGWHIQTVDSQGYVGRYTSIAVDGQGHIHISYSNESSADLKYAYGDAAGWQLQVVDWRRSVAGHASLALDGSGRCHVGYIAGGVLRSAVRDDEIAYGETVDPAGLGHVSIAVDILGGRHMSYHAAGADLKYAYGDASGWHVETVDSQGNVGYYTSIAVDGSGYPHIGYFDATNGDLKYAFRDAAGWHVQTVAAGGSVGHFTSLALDGSGYPHISYTFQSFPSILMYAFRDAAGWHSQPVDWGGDCSHTSLALSAEGYPHISFCDGWNQALKYVYHNGAGWHFQTVDSQIGGIYLGTSLALSAEGYAHIGYYDWRNGDLRYAYHDAEGWHIQTVDSEGDVGEAASLALDSAGLAHIAYCDASVKDLKYARMVSRPVSSPPALPLRIAALHVWPNPARSLVHARLAVPEGQGMIRLTVVDLLGRRVMSLEGPEAVGADATVSFRLPESIPVGQYFLGVEGAGSRFVPITVVK